jgi:hypothetical protein
VLEGVPLSTGMFDVFFFFVISETRKCVSLCLSNKRTTLLKGALRSVPPNVFYLNRRFLELN